MNRSHVYFVLGLIFVMTAWLALAGIFEIEPAPYTVGEVNDAVALPGSAQ